MCIVLITNNSIRGRALAHLIADSDLKLDLIIIEDTGLRKKTNHLAVELYSKWVRPVLSFMKKWFVLNSMDRAALKYETNSIEQALSFTNKLISINNLNKDDMPKEVESLITPSLNEAQVISAVIAKKPAICIVYGVSPLRSRLVSVPSIGTINVHTSILPEYQGFNPEFWQCYNQDYSNVGVTFYFMAKGEDMKKVLFQTRQEVKENADPNTLRLNNTIAILENYVPVIKKVLKNEIEPKTLNTGTTPTYRFRDISEEKRLRLYKRLLRANG